MNELPDTAKILLKQAELCLSDLPQSYTEWNQKLWQAFKLGEEYQKLGGDQTTQITHETFE